MAASRKSVMKNIGLKKGTMWDLLKNEWVKGLSRSTEEEKKSAVGPICFILYKTWCREKEKRLAGKQGTSSGFQVGDRGGKPAINTTYWWANTFLKRFLDIMR